MKKKIIQFSTEHRKNKKEHRTQKKEHRTQNTEHRTQNTEIYICIYIQNENLFKF